jgi:hypothetical protein
MVRARNRFDDLDAEIEDIDPGKAERYLSINKEGNRKPSTLHVKKLTSDMEEGRWRFTGDPIRFDVNGHLVDGQHRMMAIMESNTVHKFLVLRNVSENQYAVLDQTKPRHLKDMLRNAGATNATDAASVVTLYYALLDTNDTYYKFLAKPTPTQGLKLWHDMGGDETFKPNLTLGRIAAQKSCYRSSVATMLKMIYDQQNEEYSNRFWNNIIYKNNADQQSDASTRLFLHTIETFTDRKLITESQPWVRNRSGVFSTRELIGWTTAAWDRYVNNRDISEGEAKDLFSNKYIDRYVKEIKNYVLNNPLHICTGRYYY